LPRLHRNGNLRPRRDKVAANRWLRLRHVAERTLPFFRASFSRAGLGSRSGRQLIRGKLRRFTLSAVPSLARALQRHYGLTGSCARCGASCQLLFQCPHWDGASQLCTVYEDRPNVCRLFPITPADLSDRDLVAPQHACGLAFVRKSAAAEVHILPQNVVPLEALTSAASNTE